VTIRLPDRSDVGYGVAVTRKGVRRAFQPLGQSSVTPARLLDAACTITRLRLGRQGRRRSAGIERAKTLSPRDGRLGLAAFPPPSARLLKPRRHFGRWKGFLEDLLDFPLQVSAQDSRPREVPARARETSSEPAGDRVRGKHHDDRDALGRGRDGRAVPRNNDVDCRDRLPSPPVFALSLLHCRASRGTLWHGQALLRP
jgi:hypothetical protein